MTQPRELRGFGSVLVGGARYADIEYRLFIRDNGESEPDAVGIIAGDEPSSGRSRRRNKPF